MIKGRNSPSAAMADYSEFDNQKGANGCRIRACSKVAAVSTRQRWVTLWGNILSHVFMFCAVAGPSLSGQTPADTAQTPTIRTTTREVVLDVVVRDKHHHAISDLRPDEIRVFEDGAPQKVNAFRNVQGMEQLQSEQALAKSTPSVSPSAPGPAKPSTTLRQINFVSVVFAQIAPLNLEFAREAVNDFLSSDRLPNTYVTIYRLDHVLHVVQPYTADKTALISAVNAAAKGSNGNRDLGISADAASGINASIQAQTANIIASPASTAATDQAAQEPSFESSSCDCERSFVGKKCGISGRLC